MRTLTGVGTPRSLQGRAVAALAGLWQLLTHPEMSVATIWTDDRRTTSDHDYTRVAVTRRAMSG